MALRGVAAGGAGVGASHTRHSRVVVIEVLWTSAPVVAQLPQHCIASSAFDGRIHTSQTGVAAG